jgi:hypothetical protein
VQRATSPQRDPRIDVLRGFALLTICVVTLRSFGFSDAADLFVVLAGLS